MRALLCFALLSPAFAQFTPPSYPARTSTGDISTGSSLVAYGDSFTVGYGLDSPTTQGWVYQLAAAKGWATLTNVAINGDQCWDQAIRPMLQTQTASTISAYMVGFNDMRIMGTSAGKQEDYRTCLAASLAWLGVPSSQKIAATAASTSGSWSASPVLTGGKYTTSNGATMTFATAPGKTVYLWGLIQPNNTSTFAVAIDGVTVGSGLSEAATLARTENGITYSLALWRFPGLSYMPHSMVVTATAADASNGFHLFGAAAAGDYTPTRNGPLVFAANIPRMNSTGYALTCSPVACNLGSDTVVGQFDALIDQTVADLQADGLAVALADVTNAQAFDPNVGAQIQSDNIHPSAAGALTIANAFASASTMLAVPRTHLPAGIRGNVTGVSQCVNAGGSTQSVTTSYADIAGATLTLKRSGTYLISTLIDYSMSATDGTAGSVALAQLLFNGNAVAGFNPVFESGIGAVARIAMGGQWLLTGSTGQIAKLQILKIGGAGASVVNTSNTVLCATWLTP